VGKAYPNARRLAIQEGRLARFGVRIPNEEEYDLDCPFSVAEILDEDFYGVKKNRINP